MMGSRWFNLCSYMFVRRGPVTPGHPLFPQRILVILHHSSKEHFPPDHAASFRLPSEPRPATPSAAHTSKATALQQMKIQSALVDITLILSNMYSCTAPSSNLRAAIILEITTGDLPYIFGTEDGGRRLCEFLHATQVLLCLLPPRPDPP